MSYQTKLVTEEADFQGLKWAWDALAASAVDSNVFLTHGWLHSWWASYRPRAKLRIILVEKEGQTVGIAPLMLVRDEGLGGIFRRLRFIGDGTFETDHMNFIVHQEEADAILAVLLAAIDHLHWDIAHFSYVPESSSNTRQVLEYASQRGWLVGLTRVECPRRSLPSSYADLLASLPSRLRTSIRSTRRLIEANYKVEFGYWKTLEEVEQALDVLYAQHGDRWRTKGEGGVFGESRRRRFYALVATKLLEAGVLRFFYLKLDGKIVAQQFCFEYEGTVMLLQEGFDVVYSKQNVGNVLRAMVFEYLISHNVKVYDFLGGTSRHKQSWSDSSPSDLILKVCRASMVGRIAHYAPRCAARLRQSVEFLKH